MERDFKGIWIPKEIWLDEELTPLEKVILMEIDSLDNDDRGCYASNQYLADFCHCTSVKVSTTIKKLKDLGYIEAGEFDGRSRKLKSRLKETLRQTQRNFKADTKKVKGSTLYKNNIDNNIESKGASASPTPEKRTSYGEYHHVKLTASQYEKLVESYGEDIIKEYIIKVDEYCQQYGKSYKDYYLTIRNWLRKDGRGELTELAKTVQARRAKRKDDEVPF